MPSSRRTCGGVNVRGRIWNPPLQMAARPEATGKRRPPLPWQTPVGADSISARFAAARGSVGGACPSPANRGERPTKRDGPDHPGNRRAGCPHPAGPAAARTSAGGINPAPTNRGKRPAARETAAVGRDACIPAGRTGVFWRFCENPGRWFEFSAPYGIIAGKRLLYDFCTAACRSGWRRPGNRLLARNSTIPLRGMV